MCQVQAFISLVMPVRNEARFIAKTLGQLLSQDYPRNRYEILVVDGMSEDGTRDIVSRLAAKDARIRLLDNPRKLSSVGRNVGFRAGRGDYFVVVDGHCHIPTNQFLRDISDCFERSGAHCLGRPQPLDPPGLSPFQESVALARASRLGHGGDSLIYGDWEGYASPVSNGAAYRREVFDRVGYVNEGFDACEDVEFNYRLQQAGLTAYTSPRLTVRYFPRENLGALFAQMRRYGRGRTRFYFRHPRALRLSAIAPPLLVGLPVFAASLWSLGRAAVAEFPAEIASAIMGLPFAAYVLLVAWFSLRICREHGWDHFLRLPPIYLAVHVGLGVGMWEELLAVSMGRPRGLAPDIRGPVHGWLRRRFNALPRMLSRKPFVPGPMPGRGRRSDGPIRVALMIDAIASPTGGTERQLLMLAKGLDRRRFLPFLCVLRSSEWLKGQVCDCPVHEVGVYSLCAVQTFFSLVRFALFLRRNAIDIVQPHFRDASAIGILAGWMARVPGIVAMRKSQGYWMTRSVSRGQKILNMLPDVFVANSESTRDWVCRVEGIARERICVIHNGSAMSVNVSRNGSGSEARKLLGLDGAVPVAGIVANLRPVKRVDVFLRAAALVLAEVPDAIFVIVGEGDQRPDLEELADALGVRERTLFLGSRQDVESVLPAFDVGVLSSDSESFSNSVVEYMAAGLPVAATDVGGCREALEGSRAGILVRPGDATGLGRAIVQLLGDQELRELAGIEHPKRVQEKFSATVYYSSYESLYQDIMFSKN
jgi:glycosyltransferase involved in cell wall biosynthesis/GT2 family glycosyltransferase